MKKQKAFSPGKQYANPLSPALHPLNEFCPRCGVRIIPEDGSVPFLVPSTDVCLNKATDSWLHVCDKCQTTEERAINDEIDRRFEVSSKTGLWGVELTEYMAKEQN